MSEPTRRGEIQLVDLTKRFGEQTVVDHVNLHIGKGEFFSLLGPSGCGKTTTLRMIAGFEDPTAGRVILDGVDVTALSPVRRDVNLVFQSYALFPHMTAFDNVAFGLRIKRVPRDEIERRVREALAVVRMEEYARHKPGQLSGGQQQRVAVARALVMRPAAVLLDEPLGSLDLKLRKEMQQELRRIHGETGMTFVYVTHDQEEAMTMSDRIAVMNRGVVEQVGSPQDLYERPASAFVAGFVGQSNVVRVRPVRREGTALVADYGVEGRVVVHGAPQAAGDDKVTVLVRPEKLSVCRAPGEGDSYLAGTVTEAVFVGEITQLAVRLLTGDAVTVHELNDGCTALPRVGDRVVVTWRSDAAIPADGSLDLHARA